MATNYVQQGCIADYTNTTGASLLSGTPTPIGTRQIAISLVDLAVNETGSVQVDGVFKLSKTAGHAISIGQPVFWDATNGCSATVEANDWFVGHAFREAYSADTTCDVSLAPFNQEGPRLLALPATGASTLTAADLMCGDLTVLCANTAAKTVNLPAIGSIPVNAKLRVKKVAGGAFALTLDPANAETINGAGSYAAIDADGDYAEFQSDGSTWVLITNKLA
jgi:predicted RecA/RadA family phage recombinase